MGAFRSGGVRIPTSLRGGKARGAPFSAISPRNPGTSLQGMVLGTDERRAVIGAEAGAMRLDKALAAAFSDVSRSRLQDLVREGHVRRDGRTVLDPSQKVGPGTVLTVTIPEAAPAEPVAETL